MADNRQMTAQALGRRPGGPGSRFTKVNEKPKDMKKSLSRLISYISSSRKLFFALILIVIFYTVVNVYTNLVVKDVVASLGTYDIDQHAFTMNPDKDQFQLSIIILTVCYVVYSVLQYFSSLLGAYLATKTVRKMRNDLFARMVYLPISYLDRHSHGDLMSRMTNDVDNVSQAISSSISSLISGVLTILGCLGIMIFYSPMLTMISFVVLALTLLLTKVMSKYIRPLFVKQQAVLGSLNGTTEEMVTGYKTVKAYNREEKAIQTFNEYSDQFTKTAIKAQILGSSMGPFMNFIGNIGYFLVCLVGSLCILNISSSPFLNAVCGSLSGEPLSIAVIVMFLTTTKQFTRPINEIAQLYSSIVTALAGAERVFAVLDAPKEDFSKKEEFHLEEIKGELTFSHVKFSYEKDKPVLKDFSMHAKPGSKIALVGATGSGKTTIVNLLLRYYDIDSGNIKIDDHDIMNISKDDLRKAISIVLQDPVLFADTIENNIRYGKENATDEEVDDALRLANCTFFVSQMKEGKKSLLSEGATNISQGQRQLLTIARAIIAQPKILILDEATSSVDTRTEKHIQEALEHLMKNRTSIIIAHRLSTIRDADLILVLDQGRVVEQGNHEELLKINGVYRSLYETQFHGLNT